MTSVRLKMALQHAPGAISLARHRQSGGLPKDSGQKAYLVKLGPKIGYLTGGVGAAVSIAPSYC